MAGPSFPEPSRAAVGTAEQLVRFLDFLREGVIAKAASLPEVDRTSAVLPSGWTPVELLTHLAFMERRWMVWGFRGEHVEDPWGDHRDDAWYADPDRSFEDLVALLRETGSRTAELLRTRSLDDHAPPGPRFEHGEPTLAWVGLHVLQEYARHAGHLDVVVELAGGLLGE